MPIQPIQPIATQNVLIKGYRIAYNVLGIGTPVVLLHGTPSSSLIWRDVVPHLIKAGYQLHLFDLLGYGLSERPWDPQVDTSITGQIVILEGLLTHWNLEKFHLIAHDIGGGIAQRFTIFNPSRILSLTMIDVVSFDSYPSTRTKQQMASGLESLTKVDSAKHREHFRKWLLSAVYNKQEFADSSLDTFLDYISGPIGQPSLFQHQVGHYDPKHTMEISDRYHELGRVPVKLIWGAEDAWQVTDWAHKLHGAIPGSELEIIDGAGHFSPEDQPERIASLLVAFLGKFS